MNWTKGAALFFVLAFSGCTIYHYVDTCTRSQLMLKGWGETFELPSLETKDWRCNQPAAAPTVKSQ